MSIASTEDFFITTVKNRFAARLRAVESLPAEWSEKEISRVLRGVPGVFVTFLGGDRIPDYPDLAINSKWSFFMATAHASGELARRRGDTREIGGYEGVEILVALLEHIVAPDAIHAAQVMGLTNLFDTADEFQGVTIFRVDLQMAMLIANAATSALPVLDNFLTFDGRYDMAPQDGRIDAEDKISLPPAA